MRIKKASLKFVAVLAAVSSSFAIIPRVAAQTQTVLHSFKSKEGASPLLGLIFDSSGNLYGVASVEGTSRAGSVFELSPSGSGWTEKTLHAFNGGTDGDTPMATLAFDKSGNLYGTTKLGGSHHVGVVYELIKSKSGNWSETVLHNFGAGKDGQFPTGNLIFDFAGNLYGTTEGGGFHGDGTDNVGGTAFKLAPKSGGGFTESVLHSFGGSGDGVSPRANLIFDSSGNLYGTTFLGGSHSAGTVFELSPKSGGSWTETILHSFDPSNDGQRPIAGLIFDLSGNLYGTTTSGGGLGGGIVFQLSPKSGGTWSETVLYSFEQPFFQPSAPYAGLVFDAAGNLYGATYRGSGNSTLYDGTVFELTPSGGGQWNEITLSAFGGSNGAVPGIGALTFDSAGNLYGATQAGGANKDGVAFKITP